MRAQKNKNAVPTDGELFALNSLKTVILPNSNVYMP